MEHNRKCTTVAYDHYNKVKTMVMAALLMALVVVATSVLVIPTPSGGYLNLGDAVVLLGAYLLGPVYGAAAGGFGSALADLLAGYGLYVPVTLAIKALMGLTAALLYRLLQKRSWGLLVCGAAAESIMVLGYCLFEAVLAGELRAGLIGVPANLAQAAFGIAASALLTAALRKSEYVRKTFPRL